MGDYGVRNWWKGLEWKLVGFSVAGIIALQLVAHYFLIHYQIIQSLSLTVLLVSYIIIPRAKSRKLANALVGVIAVWVIGVVLEITLEHGLSSAIHLGEVMPFIELTVIPLLLGIAMAYGYLRLTTWSTRKRMEMDARRKEGKSAPTSQPAKRVHHKNRRKK